MAKVIAALIRHGDYQQLTDTPSAHQPFPLTEKGFFQANTLADLIEERCTQFKCQINPVIASSRLLRAWQTDDQQIFLFDSFGFAGTVPAFLLLIN
jgi:2,3-bisphosphoglycerate-dependent phosphoglycerate mutase